MKKEIYFCDHCGKELNINNDYYDVCLDVLDFTKVVNLCSSCCRELCSLVKEFVNYSPIQ